MLLEQVRDAEPLSLSKAPPSGNRHCGTVWNHPEAYPDIVLVLHSSGVVTTRAQLKHAQPCTEVTEKKG